MTGVALFTLGRGRPAVRLLGVTLAFWGVNFALNFLPLNTAVTILSPNTAVATLQTATAACLLGASIPLAWRYPDGATRKEDLGLGLVLAFSLLWLARALWADLRAGTGLAGLVFTPQGPGLPTALALTAAAFLPSAFAIRAWARPADAPRLARLSLVFGLYSAYNAGRVIVMLTGLAVEVPPDAYHYLVLTLLPVPLWLVLGARGHSPRLARNTAVALAAVSFMGAGLAAILGSYQTSQYGIPGALRSVSWGILAAAVLRHGLLERDLPRVAVSRGPLAAGSLAALFIVAQIAQEFFAAEYGLLLGGVVAGTLLFAAHPIQRAMERVTEGRTIVPSAPPQANSADGVARREEVYLNAVRLALRDRRLTRTEERHLTQLAEELGIGAGRAHELLVQAEMEAGVA